MKKVSLVKTAVLALIILLCFSALFISPVKSVKADLNDNFKFTDIDVSIDVREDKTFEIHEVLTVYFWRGNVNTGIIRDIQRISNTTRIIDGEAKKGTAYIADLSDVSVKLDGGEARVTQSFYDDGNFYSIMMQNPSGYMQADSTHVFELSYIYGMGDDKARGFDDFTFDILGYAMNSAENFKATITFPRGTDLSNVSFRTNELSVWVPVEGEGWRIDDNVITVKTGYRRSGEGLTIQVILDDGYFKPVFKIRFWYYFAFLAIALAGVGLLLWLCFGLNKKPVAPVEFYPPEGMDIMRFSAIWNAGAKSGDTAALILKWAGMGIIDIQSDGKKDFILTVNKAKGKSNTPSDRLAPSDKKYFDYPAEEGYFNALFSGIAGPNFTFSTRAYRQTHKKNKEKLYKLTEALMAYGNKVPCEAVREEFGERIKNVIPFVSLIPMFSIIGYFCIIMGSAIPLFFFPFMAAGTLVAVLWRQAPAMLILLIFPVFFVGLTYGICFFMCDFLIYDYCKLYFIAPLIYVVGAFVLPFLISYRTVMVEKDYGRILGFRQFLLTAELPRIEMLFDENPEYFADILPYCLIMGISDKVCKRFAWLNLPLPHYVEENINLSRMHRCWHHHSHYGRPPQTGGWSSGGGSGGHGGGGGHGGSSGGGGGGGGSRGC